MKTLRAKESCSRTAFETETQAINHRSHEFTEKENRQRLMFGTIKQHTENKVTTIRTDELHTLNSSVSLLVGMGLFVSYPLRSNLQDV